MVPRVIFAAGLGLALSWGCRDRGEDASSSGPPVTLGERHVGEYHLGPVEWEGSFWNSCGPYPSAVRSLEGQHLAGLGLAFNGDGQMCDACIAIETDAGRSIVARVITTGETSAPGNIDVSQSVFDAIRQNEYPRAMGWQVAACPGAGKIRYQFQTEASAWWTSLWVRNLRYPLEKVEVKSTNHPDWAPLRRGSDGTYTDGSGFGPGPFALRLTALDGTIIEDHYDGFKGGDLLESSGP